MANDKSEKQPAMDSEQPDDGKTRTSNPATGNEADADDADDTIDIEDKDDGAEPDGGKDTARADADTDPDDEAADAVADERPMPNDRGEQDGDRAARDRRERDGGE